MLEGGWATAIATAVATAARREWPGPRVLMGAGGVEVEGAQDPAVTWELYLCARGPTPSGIQN